jgi:hypothetical protein
MQLHQHHLTTVLQTLRNHQLKEKLSKCNFGQLQVEYLGHIICGTGVSTDPSKIAEIIKWKTPKNLKKLR